MLQNYFFINRFILELKPLLVDSKIEEIFSQEKSKLVLVTSKKDDVYFLEICVIPGNSYLNLRRNYSRAKKNTVNFFNDLIGKKISSIEIADNDRVVRISCSNLYIYFAIRGKFTNILYTDDDNIYAFKSSDKINLQNIKKEFCGIEFIDRWNSLVGQIDAGENKIEVIRKNFPFIGREIAKEIKVRTNDSNTNELEILFNVLDEIKISLPCIFINEPEQEINIAFEKFKSIPFSEKKIFNDICDAVNFVLSKKHYLEQKYSRLNLIRNHLERELKKISNKINNLRAVIDRGSKEEEFKKYGKLLLSNIGAIKNRMNSILVDDIFTSGEKIKIPLNPALSPKKNIDHYFEKSRSEKISFEKNIQLLKKAINDFENYKQLHNSIDSIESTKEMDALMKSLKIKSHEGNETKDDPGSKFKQYIVDNKYRVFVGKDSKNNDLLTTKFAKQNDYWFHARSVSGSHIVLRIDNSKEPVPKNILKKVASLAAFHSKAKTAGIVPVAYTFKKYVVKKKGDPVGTVHLLREDVLLVKPEVPQGCEYINAQ